VALGFVAAFGGGEGEPDASLGPGPEGTPLGLPSPDPHPAPIAARNVQAMRVQRTLRQPVERGKLDGVNIMAADRRSLTEGHSTQSVGGRQYETVTRRHAGDLG
jgi:hypothetical protein